MAANPVTGLEAKRGTLQASLEAIDLEALTDETRASFDALEGQIRAADGDIARAKARQEAAKNAPAVAAFDGNGLPVPLDAPAPRLTNVRDLAAEKPWGYQWIQAGAKPQIIKYASAGEFFQAVAQAGMNQGTDPRLLYRAAVAGNSEGIPSDGGFAVGLDVSNEINVTMTGGQLLSRVDHLPISANANGLKINMVDESSRATGSRFGGVTGYWIAEGVAPTLSKPTLWQFKLELNKLGALGAATDELLQDSVLMGRVMTTAFAEELKFLAEDAIYNGTGVGQPAGIVGHASTVSVAKETGQAAATIVYENVLKMWMRMPDKLRANAVWLYNQEAEAQLWGMSLAVGVGGVPVFLPPGGASEAPYARLFTRPLIPVEYAAALGTVGDIVLANLDEYGFADKGGVQQAESMHFYFDTGQTAFRAFYRLDGRPKWRTVLTPFKGGASSTRGPNVTLDTRA